MIYDCAIIGSGPAGLEAAINLKTHNKNFLWFGSKSLSDKVALAEKINNYPGFYGVNGKQLQQAFLDHADKMGIQPIEQMVTMIMKMKDHYALSAGPDFYEAKTIIITTGVSTASTIENEQKFLGRGVSYCATCDGNLYKGKTIAVLSYSKRFEHEVNYLAELANKVYLYTYYPDVEINKENVELRKGKITSFNGERKVTSISVKNSDDIVVDGVFCLRNNIALSTLLTGLETQEGHIKVDRMMRTNLEGVYAAGDCTGRPYQYSKAIGEGNVASLAVVEYLDEKKKEVDEQ